MQNSSSSPISGIDANASGIVRGNGGFSPLRLPFTLIFGALCSVVVGVALFFSGKLVYLIFVSAFFAALITGFFGQLAVKFGKIRNTSLGFLFGLILGLIAYGAYWGAEYVNTILDVGNEVWIEIRNSLTRNGLSASETDVENQLNEVLKELTDSTGFIGLMKLVDMDLQEQTGNTGIFGYISYQAQQGFTISRVGSDIGNPNATSNAPAIKDGLAWGYYGIELLMFTLAGAIIASGAARDPFCVGQNQWLKLKPVGEVVNGDPFMQAVQNGDLRTASQYIQPFNSQTPLPKLRIDVGRCNEQSAQGILKISLMPKGRKTPNDDEVLFDQEFSHIDQLLGR